jgi:molybdopterin molybdotransferase
MKLKGYNILAEGVIMKPGMACAYGIRDGKLLLALSGNPASALTNLQCVCAPALRKLTGLGKYRHKIIPMILKRDFKKGSNSIRFIRGMMDYEDGRVILNVSPDQGNIVISSVIGCNAYGIIPPGQSPVLSGETIEGFIV